MDEIIYNPIEGTHPIEVVFGAKILTKRQQGLLYMMPGYGTQVVVRKRDVSMLDLSALTAKTGDEFALFSRGGERLIVRGNNERVPINKQKAILLKNLGYRWSGHTHPGITDLCLISSDGDKYILALFEQNNSVIYNAAGRYRLIIEGDN